MRTGRKRRTIFHRRAGPPHSKTLERMNTFPLAFTVLAVEVVDERRFVEFWSGRYPRKNERLYMANIGKPLTPKRLMTLFKWKNGGPIAEHKRMSIRRNYIESKPSPPPPQNRDAVLRFIQLPGGVIWRIFWLHCHLPEVFPIFDQHVYRAMHKLTAGRPAEPPTSNLGKALAYVDEYRSFHASFELAKRKQLDEALWSYGKYLKGENAL